MDAKDALLLRALAALLGARDVLEQVLDDDDDAILSASLIDGGTQMDTKEVSIKDTVEDMRRTAKKFVESYSRSRNGSQRLLGFMMQSVETQLAAMVQEIENTEQLTVKTASERALARV